MIVKLHINMNLIQNIRLVHALSEIGIKVLLNKKDKKNLILLKNIFNLKLITESNVSTDKYLYFSDLEVDHSKPNIRIGNVNKPLIFPIEMFHYLKKLWPEKKSNKMIFSGLISDKRKIAILDYINKNKNKNENKITSKLKLILVEIMQKIPLKLRFLICPKFKVNLCGVHIINSIRGRKFPEKSFDNDYYSELLNSKFVLCPDGDFIWTYRFFESVMCGAIPVIENYCDKYSGYKFRTMNEKISELEWCEKDALHNFNLCLNQLSINDDDKINIINHMNEGKI